MNLQTKDEKEELKVFKGQFDARGLHLFHQIMSYGISHDDFLRGVREAFKNRAIYDHRGHRVSCLPCISCPANKKYRKYGPTCDRIVLRAETFRKERCTTCSKRFENYERRRNVREKKDLDRKLRPLLPK